MVNPEDLTTLVLLALAAELHEIEQGDLTEERVVRAEMYVDWLRGTA